MEEQAGETSTVLLVRHLVLTKASEQPVRLDGGGVGAGRRRFSSL